MMRNNICCGTSKLNTAVALDKVITSSSSSSIQKMSETRRVVQRAGSLLGAHKCNRDHHGYAPSLRFIRKV